MNRLRRLVVSFLLIVIPAGSGPPRGLPGTGTKKQLPPEGSAVAVAAILPGVVALVIAASAAVGAAASAVAATTVPAV